MEVLIHKHNQHAIILEIRGELDMYNSSKLKTTVKSLWKKGRTPLIFDLKDLFFIDSSGIGVLIYFYMQMNDKKQPFYLVNLRSTVQKVIQLTGIEDLLPIEHTIDNALSLITG
ncbi:MAG: STAS domain-containing protein [Spirochaetales bacterium]|nr:STAS domain-containing protein [Spirochaetales bacterium]